MCNKKSNTNIYKDTKKKKNYDNLTVNWKYYKYIVYTKQYIYIIKLLNFWFCESGCEMEK